MKIARFILAVLILLGGLSLFTAGERVWDKHRNVLDDAKTAELAIAKSDWLEGAVALSFERSVTQVALALDGAAPREFRTLIEDQRRQSDALFSATLARLEDQKDFGNAALFLQRVQKARENIAALRREADDMLSRDASSRDAARVKAAPYELKALIENLYASSALLVLPHSESSSEEIMLNHVQKLAWEIREYGGRARTFYAIAALTGRPIPRDAYGEAVIDTARAKAGYRQLQIAVQALDLPEPLIEAVADLETPFASTYLAALERFDAAMAKMHAGEDAPMPFEFAEFFALSNAGLDAVADLAPLASVHIQQYWDRKIAASRISRLFNVALMLVLCGLTALSIAALQKKLVKPLMAATVVLKEVADGNLERKFRQKSRGPDELHVVWDALETLTATLRRVRDDAEREKQAEQAAKEGVIGDLLAGLEKMAKGDLTHKIENRYGPTYEALVSNYNATTDTLSVLVSEVVGNAGDIADQSVALGRAIEDLSRRTEIQSTYVAETVGTLEDFSTGIRAMAESAGQSDAFAGQATDKARDSREVMDGAMQAMTLIEASSHEISKFTRVIDEIAFQTGLLALNAGVEAARAGSAGDGFAVVAQEIRDLAQRAGHSSAEVKSVVQQSLAQVETGAREVAETGQSLEEIVDMVRSISERIAEISGAAQKQKAGISEIGATMDQLDEMTKQNAEMVELATQSSETLQQKARALRSAVDRFAIANGPGAALRREAA